MSEHLRHYEEPERVRTLRDVEPIQSAGAMIKRREEIKNYVEVPLLKACEELYDKNIETNASDANYRSIERRQVGLGINYDSLSDENKAIADQLIDEGIATTSEDMLDQQTALNVYMSVTEQTTVKEIEDYYQAIVDRFRKQAMAWAPRSTIQEIRARYGDKPNDETYGPDAYDEYYDPNEQRFYESEEHWRKVHEITDEESS